METAANVEIQHTLAMKAEPTEESQSQRSLVAVEMMEGVTLAVILIMFAYVFSAVAGTVL